MPKRSILFRSAARITLVVISTTIGIALAATVMALVDPPVHHNASVHIDPANPTSRYDDYFGGIPLAGTHGTASANNKTYDFWYGRFAQRLDSKGREASSPSVIVLGCSLAWGAGVDGDKTFAAMLERGLGQEVLNAAVSGTGTIYMARRLEMLPTEAKRSVNTVIYLLYEDHLYRNVRRCAAMDNPICLQLRSIAFENDQPTEHSPTYTIEWLFGGPYEMMTHWYLDQYVDGTRRSFGKDVLWSLYRFYAAADRLMHLEPDWNSSAARTKLTAALDYSLGVMASQVRTLNARFLILWVPIYSYPRPLTAMPKDIAAIVTKYADDTIDLAGPFNAMLTAGSSQQAYPFTIPNDGHFNEKGHQIIADLIVARLRERHVLRELR